MELKEKLVALRKKKGLSQLELAEMVKVSRQAVSRWEVGSAIPSADNLMWLSKLYGVSIDHLLCEDKDLSSKSEEMTKASNVMQKPEIGIKLFVLICVIVCVLVSAIWICEKRDAEKTQEFNFEEMGSEIWDNTETDGFSISW